LGVGGPFSIAYSYDSYNWVGVTTFSIINPKNCFWDGKKFFILSADPTNSIAISYDGLIYSGKGATLFSSCTAVETNLKQKDKIIFTTASTEGQINIQNPILIGIDNNTENKYCLLYSYNGHIWYPIGTPLFATVKSILWSGDKWLLASENHVFYSYDLLYLWTGNQALAESTATIVRLLIVGSTINGIMHFPYTLQLATGNERLALYINIAIIAIMIPVMIFLSARYGILGGAAGWLVQQILYFIVGVTITHAFILKGMAGRWLLQDLLPAIVVAALLVGSGHALAIAVTDISIVRLALASVFTIAAILALALGRPSTRVVAMQFYRQRSAA
jgi:hypothetical protein